MKSMLPPEPVGERAGSDPPANYLDLYGLSKPPFGGSLDSAGLILFGSQRRAFETLTDHLVSGKGVVRLVGEEGIGKTEILRSAASVASQLGAQTIMVSRPQNGRITLGQLATALIPGSGSDDPTIDDTVENFQLAPRKALLLDDVDLMPNDCIRLLLALAQLKPTEQGEAAMVLSGAQDAAADPDRQPLSQLLGLSRNTVRMPRLDPSEMQQYIERSLWIAGGTTRRLIAADAMKSLVGRAGGVPGTLNRLMEAVLTAGFARGDSVITAKTVAAAMGPATPRPERRETDIDIAGMASRALPIVATALLFTGASVFAYKAWEGLAPTEASPAPVKPVIKPGVIEPGQKQPAAVVEPGEQPRQARPADTVSPELVAALMRRGDQVMELGDVAAARLLYQRAADAGDAAAAAALGRTYDPNFAVPGSARDAQRAAEWYRKAAALGDPRAADYLRRVGPH